MSRAHRSLIILTVLTTLAAGFLANALAGPATVGSDIQVAASALLLVGSAVLLGRVLRFLSTGGADHRSPRRREKRVRGSRHTA